jgi:Cu(I)/Ag(I) efflux system membrane protein CusA/SilA
MGYLIRGKIKPENKNPVNRFLIWIYHPIIKVVLGKKAIVLVAAW